MRNEEIMKHYSLKILFGPMFGCELSLPADDYFLIINPGLALLDKNAKLESDRDHAAHYTINTLYIPCDVVSPNITLYLSQPFVDNETISFNIEIHDEKENCFKSCIRENDIFIHEHIKLSLKRSEDAWSENIKNYHLTPLVSVPDTDSVRHLITKKNRLTVFAVALFIIICLLPVFIYHKISADRQVTSLSEVLSGAPAQLDIVKGRDNGCIYILAPNVQGMEWAKEAINKLKNQQNLILVLLSKNKKDIINELYNTGYPVLQLDFSSAKYPVLAIYRSLLPREESSLKALVLKKIPFALDVGFIIKTKEQLKFDARQGLERLNIPFRQINMDSGYSLIVRDALSDNSLNALGNFIYKFNQQWGNTVITFSINLDENWLQNKSYVDSSSGYLFLNPRHWYFPLKNKEL